MVTTTTTPKTETQESQRKIDDNDFSLVKNRELNSPIFARKNVEEVDKFLSIPDLDSPSEHRRFRTKEMPVLERRKVSQGRSGLQSERQDWRKNRRKEKRKMLGGGRDGGGRGGDGGVQDMSFNTNFERKRKHGEQNLMKTKLNQFVPSLTNSKHKGKRNKRKEFEMTQKKWKNPSDNKEGKPGAVMDRIELRKAKRNQMRKNKAGSKKKFPKFPNNPKDFRKQKRKQNRQENKHLSKLSQSQTQAQTEWKRNQHHRQLTNYAEVKEFDGVMVNGVMMV